MAWPNMWSQPQQSFPQNQIPQNQFPAFNQYQQIQQRQQAQTNLEWIMVPEVRSVDQVSVQPGQKAWVMVQNEPVFAFRTANDMGLITTQYFRFEQFDPSIALQPKVQPEYVTFDQMNQAIARALEKFTPVSVPATPAKSTSKAAADKEVAK